MKLKRYKFVDYLTWKKIKQNNKYFKSIKKIQAHLKKKKKKEILQKYFFLKKKPKKKKKIRNRYKYKYKVISKYKKM